jgi:predicted RND superfamily exporter protein
MNIHERIEAGFEAWARFVVQHRRAVIGAAMVGTLGLCAGLAELRIEASIETFLRDDDAVRVAYDRFRSEFSRDDPVFLIVHAEDQFTAPFLSRLKALHEDLEENLDLVADVESLVTARVTRGSGDELVIEPLLEGWPEDGAEPDPSLLDRIRAEALDNPLYRNLFLSEDGRYGMMLVTIAQSGERAEDVLAGFEEEDPGEGRPPPGRARAWLLTQPEIDRIVESLNEIVARHERPDFPIWSLGLITTAYWTVKAFEFDMAVFTAASILIIAVLLLSLFRRTSGVLLPLLCVVLPLAGTFGAIGYLGVPVTPISQTLPSFLLAIGVCDAVHLLTLFYRSRDTGRDRGDAVVAAMGHSGLAIVMTSVTTAGCLLSFLLSDLEPLRGFGITAPLGVMLALLYSLTLLPALLAALPLRQRPRRPGTTGPLDRFLAGVGGFSTSRPWLVVGVWGVVLCATGVSTSQLRFSQHDMAWFKKGTPVRDALEISSREMKAADTLEVVVDTGRENGLHDPEVMNRLERMRLYLESAEVKNVSVGKVISMVDVVKETHQALNQNDPAYFAVPQDRQVIAQELLLFENEAPAALEKLVDPTYKKARMTVLLPSADGADYAVFEEAVGKELRSIAGDRAEVTLTGVVELSIATMMAVLSSMAKSYSMALVFLVPLMVLLIGDLKTGLLCMIPNVAPIVITLGLMNLMDIPLDMFTMMIGSVAIGVAVDDTIHFMHNFRRYHRRSADLEWSVTETLLTTGRALLVTSIALAGGFLVFVGASMVPVVQFGIVTGTTIVVAFLADVMLSPALVTLATAKAEAPPA